MIGRLAGAGMDEQALLSCCKLYRGLVLIWSMFCVPDKNPLALLSARAIPAKEARCVCCGVKRINFTGVESLRYSVPHASVQVQARRQQHNNRLWARVKGAVATRIAQSVCEN